MSLKQSLALKKRWAKVSLKVRSKRMSALAKRKHELLTDVERQKIAFTMVRAKKALINKKKR